MSSWKQKELREMLRIEHGYAFKGQYFADAGEHVILTPGNFHEDGGFRARPDKDRYYQAKFPDKYLLKRNDLIVAMTEQGEGLLGSAALVPESNTYLHNQRIGLVRTNQETANTRFLYYLFNSDYVRQQIRNRSSGAKVRHTSPERMYQVKVWAPEKQVQDKIAAILSAYDDLIENNRRRIVLLEKLAEELYREWFVRLRFPGHEKVKVVKGVPEGWQIKKIGELVETQYGYTASSETDAVGPKFLRITDIVPSTIDWESVPHCRMEEKDEEKYLLHEGDILVARTGATVGYAKRINKHHPKSVFASYLVRLIPIRKLDAVFLGMSVERNAFKDFITMFVTGAAQPQANATTMALFPLLHPSDSVLQEYNRIVEPMLDCKERLLSQQTILSRTRDMLLPRLISGKLSVENLDIQSPPSMLEPGHA